MLNRILLVAALALCSQQDAKSEKSVSLARVVPKDAMFFAQSTKLDALRADFEASAWYGFWKDEEMKPIREWFEKKLDDARAEGQKDHEGVDFDPFEFFDSIHGSMACFGVLQTGFESPAMGVLFEPGEPRGKFEDIFAQLVEDEKRTHVPSTAEYAGVELKLFEKEHAAPEEKGEKSAKHSDEPGDADEDASDESAHGLEGLEHSAFFDAGGFACFAGAGSREALLEMVHGIIDRASGKDPSNGIEGNAALTQARASVPAVGRLECFVDLQKVVEKLKAEKPPSEEDERIITALGVDDLRWIYSTGDVGKGETVNFDLALRLPDDGYLREWIDCLGRLPREMAGSAPRASNAISLAQYDVWALWQSVWKMMRELDPETAEGGKSQMDAVMQQMGGGDIEKEFLAQFDGRFASFNVPVPEEEWKAAVGPMFEASSGLQLNGAATVIGLRDAASVSKFVGKILTGMGIAAQIETEEFQGNTIHKLAMGPGAGVQWAFTKSTGVVSQFPTALRAALRMEGAEAKDSALEKESFKPLIEANADASVLGLATTAESIKNGLMVAEGMASAMGMAVAMTGNQEAGQTLEDLPLAHLPSGAAVDRHFKGTIVTSVKRKGSVVNVRLSAK